LSPDAFDHISATRAVSSILGALNEIWLRPPPIPSQAKHFSVPPVGVGEREKNPALKLMSCHSTHFSMGNRENVAVLKQILCNANKIIMGQIIVLHF
jgi:hypothetical protein